MPVTLGNQNITSSTGNLGIGTDSPVTLLTLGQSSTGAIAINSNITTSGSVPAWQAASVVGEIRARADLSLSTDGGFLRLSAGGGTNASTKAGIDMSGFNTTDGGATLRFYTGAERMRIDREGRVTMPFQLHITGTPGVGTAPGSGIANRFAVRQSTGLSFGNNRITVPITGNYLIIFQTISTNGSGRVDTNISINGTTLNSGLNNDNSSGFRMRTHTFLTRLQANDFIQFAHASYYVTGDSVDPFQSASVTLLS